MDPRQLVETSNILKGVVAYVEVKSSLGNPALAISSRLQSLGAEVVRTLGPSVTHVIFRNGSETTLQAARRHRKHIVTPAWVKACHTYKFRVVESSYGVTEKQDITLLEATVEKPGNPSHKFKENSNDVTADSTFGLSSHPVTSRNRKDQAFHSLPVPKEVVNFLERIEKRNPSESSKNDMFSHSDDDEALPKRPLLINDDQTQRIISPGRSRQVLKLPAEVSVKPLAESYPVVSTQSELGQQNPLVLCDRFSPISHVTATAQTRLVALKPARVSQGTPHRRLIPLEQDNTSDALITPVVADKPHPTPSWLKPGRSDHLLTSKPGRLSASTPLTPNLLLDVVSSARTPKSRKKANKTNTLESGVKQSPVFKSRKKVVRIIPRSLLRKQFTKGDKPGTRGPPPGSPARPQTPRSEKRPSPSNETNSPGPVEAVVAKRRRSRLPGSQRIAATRLDPRGLLLTKTAVDLDESAVPNTTAARRGRDRLSTPRMLCLPNSPESQPQQEKKRKSHSSRSRTPNLRRAAHQSKTGFPPVNSPHHSPSKKQVQNIGWSDASASSRRASVRLKSLSSKLHSTTPIQPLTTRNSLEDFQLHNGQITRKPDRAKKTNLPSCSNDENNITTSSIVLGFTGLRKDEEMTMCTLLATSKLSGYRFATQRNAHSPLSTRETRAMVDARPTHLVTVSPFRRTLKFLLGLIQGVTIVTVEWLKECAHCGTWLCPSGFKPEGLPRDSKLHRLPTLFSTYRSIYVGSLSQPPTHELIHLLELCGAKITSRKSTASLLIGCKHAGTVCVKPSWVLDSIVKAQLQPTAQYSMSL